MRGQHWSLLPLALCRCSGFKRKRPFSSRAWVWGRTCAPLPLLCPRAVVTSFSPSHKAGSQLASPADTRLSATALARLTSQYLACAGGGGAQPRATEPGAGGNPPALWRWGLRCAHTAPIQLPWQGGTGGETYGGGRIHPGGALPCEHPARMLLRRWCLPCKDIKMF